MVAHTLVVVFFVVEEIKRSNVWFRVGSAGAWAAARTSGTEEDDEDRSLPREDRRENKSVAETPADGQCERANKTGWPGVSVTPTPPPPTEKMH